MTHLPIKDIEKGTDVEGQVYPIRDIEVKEGSNGKFMKCVLFDATGEAQGMFFDWPEDLVLSGPFVLVDGTGDEFNGTRQIKLSRATDASEPDDLSVYIRQSVIPKKVLEHELTNFLANIQDPEIGVVVGELLIDNLDALLEMPAAMNNHHAYRSGLAEHVVSMLRLADGIAHHYQRMYGTYQDEPVLDHDLLIAGVMLHDLAKVFDFERDGLGYRMGAHATLVGHIPECDAQVAMVCRRNNVSVRTEQRLRHMVLSHHGQLAWGSPVTPALLEAQLLHYIDMIDSRFNMVRELTDGLEPGEVSERSWALRGRVVR